MKKLVVTALAFLLAASLPAFAGRPGVRDPGVNKRQHHQQNRITQGVRSGELTRGGFRHLEQKEAAVRREERQYESDGRLTKEERKDLHQDLNQMSRDIYREKHGADKRPKAQ